MDWRDDIRRLTLMAIIGLLWMLTLLSLAGCSPVRYVPIETVRTEYRMRDSVRHDSIHVIDSVTMMQKGDTVYKEKYKYMYKYLFLNRTDTVISRDTVQVPYPVEKELTRWQSVKIEFGGAAIGALLALVVIRVARRFIS